MNPGCSLEGSWHLNHGFSSVQSLSCVRLFATPWTAARQASLSITNSRSLPKLKSIESVMPSNHLILCCPLFLLPSIFPSIRVFSNESAYRIRWPKYWSFSFNISPSNEHSGLISSRMDWLDLLAVQGTLKSLLQAPQFKSINSSALSFFYSPTLTSWFQLFVNAALWNKIMGRNWFIVWEIFEFTKWLFTWRPLNVSREYCLKFELVIHIS